MRFIRLSLNILLLSMLIVACSNKQENEQLILQTANPTVDEIMTENNDIFLWNNLVYMTDIDWVNELILTENELIGSITKVSSNAVEYTNGTANKLSVGAEIYSTNERGDILIVKDGNAFKYYLKLVEG